MWVRVTGWASNLALGSLVARAQARPVRNGRTHS